jgi:RNase P subunit RPR2
MSSKKLEPNVCINCNSGNVAFYNYGNNNGLVYFYGTCNECGTLYREVYKMEYSHSESYEEYTEAKITGV